jgi:hypothetical protein
MEHLSASKSEANDTLTQKIFTEAIMIAGWTISVTIMMSSLMDQQYLFIDGKKCLGMNLL